MRGGRRELDPAASTSLTALNAEGAVEAEDLGNSFTLPTVHVTPPSATGSAAVARDPQVGDTVYIVGHGPARVEDVMQPSPPTPRKKFQVVFPDGTSEQVAREQILAHEAQPRRTSMLGMMSPRMSGSSPAGPSPCVSPPLSPKGEREQRPALSPQINGPRDLEYLSRAFDDSGRNISTPSAIFSLVATMVGGGVLSLPFAMSQCGLVAGTLALFASAAASTWTLDMLVDCARCTGRDTFELVGHAAFGEKIRQITMTLVFMICWLAMVGYYVILGDLLVPLIELAISDLKGMQDQANVRRVILCSATVVLAPMCFKSNLHALRFLCFASVGSVLIVGAVIAGRAWPNAGIDHKISILLPDRTTETVHMDGSYALWPKSWLEALYAFPMFGVSFLCHFNALPTHQELTRPTRYRIRRVLVVTMTLTTILYFFVAISGYLYAGACTCGNILLNFGSKDSIIMVGRAALSAVIILNFPLILQPARNALFCLISGTRCYAKLMGGSAELGVSRPSSPDANSAQQSQSPTGSDVPLCSSPPPPARKESRVHVYLSQNTRVQRDHRQGLDELDSFAPKDETVQQSGIEPTACQRYFLTAALLGGALLLSCFLQSVMVVWSIVGSTVAFLVGYILPAAFWFKLVGPFVSAWQRSAAVGLASSGLALAIACTVLTMTHLGVAPCPLPSGMKMSVSSVVPFAAGER